MANASCTACTLVSNVLTLTGSVSGTVAVGMTVTGPSVQPGVTITSFGTGSGGIGTYNCSASGTNIPSSEAMVFSLTWVMPTIGNASSPQLLDLARAAGFGLIFATAINGGSAGPGREAMFGTHAQAVYTQQTISTQVFKAAAAPHQGQSVATFIGTQPQYPEPRTPVLFRPATAQPTSNLGAQYSFGTHAKAIYDSQIQARVWAPTIAEAPSILGTQYTFGTHAKAIADSQIQAQVFKSAIKTFQPSDIAPVRVFLTNPQELTRDLTIQGWVSTIPVPQGFLLTMVTAGPQFADLTLEATISQARPFQSAAPSAPINPAFFFAQPQADPTQPPAKITAPPLRKPAYKPLQTITAAPTPWDPSVTQGQIFPTALPGPAKYVQPAIILVYEQIYDKNVYPLVITTPLVYEPPPINTGFYVMAVSAGFYGGRFRTPGDIFLLASALDFSDSSVDYQPADSNTVGYGWMQKVTTQQAFDWLQSNGSPYLPPSDPNRRFIY